VIPSHPQPWAPPQIERSTGAHRKAEEETLRALAPLTLAAVLCLFANQQGQAQQLGCGGDYVCIPDDSADVAAPPGQSLTAANLTSLTRLERCPGVPVEVTAGSSEECRLACAAASDALQLLGRCGISLRRPLNVHIMNEVRHPFGGAIFGLFDTKHERVLVTREENIPSLVKDTPYAELPQHDFYKSLVVHEVVHGIMHQNLKRQPTSHAAYEYPAYALQIASLPSDVRNKFLQSVPNRARPGELVFNDTILFFDPFFFAAHAYEHFKASANRCAHLRALLEGEVAFIPALPP
jgi:hypothetical protein